MNTSFDLSPHSRTKSKTSKFNAEIDVLKTISTPNKAISSKTKAKTNLDMLASIKNEAAIMEKN